MARIILEHKGQVLKDFGLHKGSLTLGRRKDNTIVLVDPQVSAYHARIDKRGSDYILTDLQSTNGTFVNNLKIFSHRLGHGDRIRIGRHALLFIGTEKAKVDAELDKVPLDQTVIFGGVRRRSGTPVGSIPAQPAIQQSGGSGFLRRLVFVFFLVAVIVAVGRWGFRDEPSFFRGTLSKDNTSAPGEFRPLPVTTLEPPSQEPESFGSEEIHEAGDAHPALIIDAIVWSSDEANSFALINGTKVAQGQSFDGMTVVEIGRDYVILRSLDEQSTVRLTLTLK